MTTINTFRATHIDSEDRLIADLADRRQIVVESILVEIQPELADVAICYAQWERGAFVDPDGGSMVYVYNPGTQQRDVPPVSAEEALAAYTAAQAERNAHRAPRPRIERSRPARPVR